MTYIFFKFCSMEDEYVLQSPCTNLRDAIATSQSRDSIFLVISLQSFRVASRIDSVNIDR